MSLHALLSGGLWQYHYKGLERILIASACESWIFLDVLEVGIEAVCECGWRWSLRFLFFSHGVVKGEWLFIEGYCSNFSSLMVVLLVVSVTEHIEQHIIFFFCHEH